MTLHLSGIHPKCRDPEMIALAARLYGQHRLVMARSLGRTLYRHETVHHINGDRADNGLNNLQLRFGKHGKGVAMTCAKCGSHEITYTKLA